MSVNDYYEIKLFFVFVEEDEAISKKYFKAWHMKKGTRKQEEEKEEENPLMSDEGGSNVTSDDVCKIVFVVFLNDSTQPF